MEPEPTPKALLLAEPETLPTTDRTDADWELDFYELAPSPRRHDVVVRARTRPLSPSAAQPHPPAAPPTAPSSAKKQRQHSPRKSRRRTQRQASAAALDPTDDIGSWAPHAGPHRRTWTRIDSGPSLFDFLSPSARLAEEKKRAATRKAAPTAKRRKPKPRARSPARDAADAADADLDALQGPSEPPFPIVRGGRAGIPPPILVGESSASLSSGFPSLRPRTATPHSRPRTPLGPDDEVIVPLVSTMTLDQLPAPSPRPRLHKTVVSEEEIRKRFDEADADHNGRITRQECMRFLLDQQASDGKQKASSIVTTAKALEASTPKWDADKARRAKDPTSFESTIRRVADLASIKFFVDVLFTKMDADHDEAIMLDEFREAVMEQPWLLTCFVK